LFFSLRSDRNPDSTRADATEAGPERDRPGAEPTGRSDEDQAPLRIGAVAGVGFPHPLAIEALVKIEGVLALGLEYSALPKTTIVGVNAKAWALAADARIFPFRGIDAGVQIPIGASLTTTVPAGLPPQIDNTIASIANTFGNGVTPTVDLLRIGFLF
jgi:hypothetical protein